MNSIRGSRLDRVLDWLVRRRSPALSLVRTGAGIAALGFAGGFGVDVSYPSGDGAPISVRISNGDTSGLLYVVGFFGLLLIAIGVGWEWIRDSRESKRLATKRVVVVEVRGLRDTGATPLAAAVPVSLEGRRETLLVDVRQHQDNLIVDPEAAVDNLSTLPKDLERRLAEGDRADVSVVYGGMASVPLTFLTGILIDDESALTVMDWDRTHNRWRLLDGDDDGRRFEVLGLAHVPEHAPHVALAVSGSYRVDLTGIAKAVPEMPLVEMRLHGGSIDAHWSAGKQAELGRQFFETIRQLGDRGVEQIHLFLAAQNSLVFQLGRWYDKRNLPPVTVYQYQRDTPTVFPWGIQMPVAGRSKAAVVRPA